MNTTAIKNNTIGFIFRFSIPAIIAMVLTSCVTIVDGYFVSTIINKEALAAINLGLPILYVFLAVGIMIGVGGSSIAGRKLGEQQKNKSINVFNQTLVTAFVVLLLLSVIFIVALKPILSITKLNSFTEKTMLQYYKIMLWIYPFMLLNVIFGMFLRTESKHSLFMLNTIVTTVINIVLDYVFMVVLKLGVSGAAYSSAIAVLAGTLLMVTYFLNPKTMFKFGKYQFNKADLIQTFTNGSSEFIGQIAFSITMFFLNLVILKRIGLDGIAAMTIIGYSRYIYEMIVTGFGQGISPMISYHFGAQENELCDKVRSYTSKIVLVLGFLFFGLVIFAGKYYAMIFTKDTGLINLVMNGFKLFAFSFILTGYNMISSFFFTSIGFAKQSALISSMRGLILLSINIFLLPLLFGQNGIWLIASVTELGTFVIAYMLLCKYKQRDTERAVV
ncbi:MATE family efflux transporter [Clostridium sp. 'deep sea']|uniref:MATE family efflux transporter n=1 Tax=Clostridium sp. 'deep sea' TaxID=2779445 RepID=UPI0018965970|nr:MATE family efflux transporter [Clostridium sp. 'deep sea']QOR35767.1 MATE family efflux transporter [Clostridium sp. 'deep sea']